MIYGNKKKNDQVASSTGKTSLKNCKRCPATILSPIFTKEVHTASNLRHPRSAAISKNRLPRHYTDVKGLLGFAQGIGLKEHTALLNAVLCRKTLDKKRGFEKLLASIFELARAIGILSEPLQAAIDSTGLENRHVSRHFIRCRKRPSYFRRYWPKITVVCDTQTHLIASCIVTRGPGYDCRLFKEAVGQACKQLQIEQILADGGYDSEANRREAYEVFGIDAMIKLNLRGFETEPHGKYRRQMKENFDKKVYNNRWQIESVFSRNKRLLGSALRNRTEISRERECLLRILTHNLMIIRRAA
jgi:transposase